MRFSRFAVEQRSEHNKNVRLDQGVEQRKQHADDNGQTYAQELYVIHEFGDEKSAEQRAEKAEAHGDGKRKVFQRIGKTFHLIGDDTSAHDEEVRRATHGDGAVDIG